MCARPWTRRLRGFAAKDDGATAVEFALVSPVLFVLLFAVIQLAWVLHCAASVRWSLETNARSLLINPAISESQFQAALLADLGPLADTQSLVVTLVPDATDPDAPFIRASSTYSPQIAVPFLPARQLTFSASTRVPVA